MSLGKNKTFKTIKEKLALRMQAAEDKAEMLRKRRETNKSLVKQAASEMVRMGRHMS